jgi:hypothetical protein
MSSMESSSILLYNLEQLILGNIEKYETVRAFSFCRNTFRMWRRRWIEPSCNAARAACVYADQRQLMRPGFVTDVAGGRLCGDE